MPHLNKIETVELRSAYEFLEYASRDLITRKKELGFRGHSNSDWKLEPTFTRFFRKLQEIHGLDRLPYDSRKLVLNVLADKFKENAVINNDLTQDKAEKIDIWQS
mgnify:FL=1